MGKDSRGITRAECNTPGCDCTDYVCPSDSNTFLCSYCGHYPSVHRNADIIDKPSSSPFAVDASPYGASTAQKRVQEPLPAPYKYPQPQPSANSAQAAAVRQTLPSNVHDQSADDPFAASHDPFKPSFDPFAPKQDRPPARVEPQPAQMNFPIYGAQLHTNPEPPAPRTEEGGWPIGTFEQVAGVASECPPDRIRETMKLVSPQTGIDNLTSHCLSMETGGPAPTAGEKDWPEDVVDRLAEELPENFPRERIESAVATYRPKGDVDGLLALLFSEDDSSPSFECQLCLDTFHVEDMYTVDCPASHRFCFPCIQRMVEMNIRENTPVMCPGEDCKHVMDESEVRQIMKGAGANSIITNEMIEKYAQQILIRCVKNIPGIIACPTPGCKNWIEPSDMTRKERCRCQACGAVFCSLCKGPYHYHCTCSEVRQYQAQWMEWVTSGRMRYNHDKAEAVAKINAAREELDKKNAEVMKRYRDMLADEEFKMANGRYCPKCHRVIIKEGGCDSMICGRNWHGGNIQDGCGHHFNWSQAEPYHSTVPKPEEGKLTIEIPDIAREAVHIGVTCDLCHLEIKFVQIHLGFNGLACFFFSLLFLFWRLLQQGAEVLVCELSVVRFL